MPCPRAVTGRHKQRINHLLARPESRQARNSRVLRRHLDRHGYVSPHFRWAEMACTDGTPVPKRLRHNCIRHCWNLEKLRRRLHVPVTIDGPFRTAAHNRRVGGAPQSRHLHADASDHFVQQVERWIRDSPTVDSRDELVRLVRGIFRGVGNEGSGTLHLDSRPGVAAFFIRWTPAGR